ncbi:ribonuclease P protein component [Salinibacterium sp. CAN_S4]|uniref:ribonuclease P protein component n=1 Tax=Salinibacterium sp. CAN_S4 TaxID=2787727 RepID=UPI002FF0D440
MLVVARAAPNSPRKAAVHPQTVLARANRVVQPADFRSAVRRGRRVGSRSATVHVLSRGGDSPTRFGFIVSKAVGNAVARNRVRRRLRAMGRELLSEINPGHDIVIRALPGSPEVDWVTLHAEITDAIKRGVVTR